MAWWRTAGTAADRIGSRIKNEYLAQSVDGVTMTHRRWLQLNNERRQMRLNFNAIFNDYDILLCPVATSAAFPHDREHEGKRWRRRITVNNKRVSPTDQLFWAGYSGVVYLPSTRRAVRHHAVRASDRLSGGRAQGHDKTSITFARLAEEAFGGFTPPPGYD